MKFTETHPERGLTAKSQPGVRLCPERNEPPPQPASMIVPASATEPTKETALEVLFITCLPNYDGRRTLSVPRHHVETELSKPHKVRTADTRSRR